MRKIDDWEYELTISYDNNKDLERMIDDIYLEMHSQADTMHCLVEADIVYMDGSDRSW